MITVDITADLNAEDDTGFVGTFLYEERDPECSDFSLSFLCSLQGRPIRTSPSCCLKSAQARADERHRGRFYDQLAFSDRARTESRSQTTR